MSNETSTKTLQSIKPGYNDRPSPREISEEFQDEYVQACREVNQLLADADRYFAHDAIYQSLTEEAENFRENREHDLDFSEIIDENEFGELVDEDEIYDELIGDQQESVENLDELLSLAQDVELRRDRIGQNMDYDSPLSWMMYKREAYDGQSRSEGDPNDEIATVRDLRKHTDGQDLCQKRYQFIIEFNDENTDWSIDSNENFPEEMSLEELYTDERILKLLKNQEFMGEPSDGMDPVSRNLGAFGEDSIVQELKEGGRGSWLGNEKDADGKWENFEPS